MKRCLLLLAALAAASALSAQETNHFTREDVLTVFGQYNPSVLKKAELNPAYQDVLEKLASSYSAPKTEENRLELIALAKNFDNSILLHAISRAYEDGFVLQRLSGLQLDALAARTREDLSAVFNNILYVTLELKEIRIEELQEEIKAVKADKTTDKLARKEKIKVLKGKIKAVKAEIKDLKKNRAEQVAAAAQLYMTDLTDRAEGTLSFKRKEAAAREQAQKAQASANLQIKSKNKKPVAK